MNAISKKMKSRDTPANLFRLLDSDNVGFLTIKDFQIGLPKHFDIILEHNFLLEAFKYIDSDEDGSVKQGEFLEFLHKDFGRELDLLEKRGVRQNLQYQIFEHIVKILE